ncbi:hypothetical protein CQY20_20545 [Mycolicibacterium agri]|uniref:Uncharacterized protein n=1 Tax=Mycolicibacterium agri TaxID=36811 RepID=A0A2A7MX79_MYCAG|nr:hypothetical protein [Mycolicibacterium agri]PEG35921.1 hypothetical protein CQY20_20545 [Mycolicibacterium agri]GFG54238.1 hypothetical protein MAGR_56790 [Mycolicibacterium agri]
MSRQSSDDGIAKAIGGLIFFVIVLISVIPKEIWIAIGVAVGGALLIWFTAWAINAYSKHRAEVEARLAAEEKARAAAAKREREEKARREKQQRIATLGRENADLVESALAAVQQVRASEAARTGWLGDVDFTADIQEITAKFQKAHALRKLIRELSALDKPSPDDRKILAEARTTASSLELAAIERVELIGKCATEARLIDQSLREERRDAQTAEQRAELHAKLSAMLYGIEATPDTTPRDLAADVVMARVQAYRDIKDRIQQARDI